MANKATLLTLKLVLILLFASWISLWILKPTQLWTRIWKAAEEKASASIFGYNGICFVVYTFPVLALAMIGFVSLALKHKEEIHSHERRCLAFLTNPLIVNCSLGILSGIEIVTVSLFIAFLAWTFYARISRDLEKTIPVKGFKLTAGEYIIFRVATRFGLLAEACLAFLLLPVLRRIAVFRLLGLRFEASVRYHTWLGTAMTLFATLHGVGTFFIWGIKHRIREEMWRWQRSGRIYLAGEITLVAGLIIWITSIPVIRRKWFEVFYYTHHLYIVFLLFFLFHVGDRHFYMVFPGIFLFALDKILRIIESIPQTCVLSARVFPSKTVELVLPKHPRTKYTPTSVVFVKIPSISRFQWHPFSLTSSSSVDDHTMSIMIKTEGSWGASLYNMLTSTASDSETGESRSIPVAVEGPYGPATMDFLGYEKLLLVAGGIGITPFLSIIQEIFLCEDRILSLPARVQIIYATKRSEDVCMLNDVVSRMLDSKARIQWKLKVYVTQEQEKNTTLLALLDQASRVIRVKNFDSKFSGHVPYGPENLYWLSGITASASVLFILLLVLFNRVVFRNANESLSSENKTASSVIDLFLLCSFALSVASVVLIVSVWRLKISRKEALQFTNRDSGAAKPCLTETNRSNDQELEVHFGARPNFQDVFAEYKNESKGCSNTIGVFVCGPESMKESVALACRAGNQENRPHFSFHPLNFTL